MKVLITGVSGFIGARLLTAACVAYGRENVVALSSRANEECDTIVYDGSDFGVNRADLAKLGRIEVLIHAGAYIPKSSADVNAIAGCNRNIFFTEKLVGLPFNTLRKIIYLSTVDVYDAVDPITEVTPTLPLTLYGMSKLYCERLASIFAAEEKIACQILRLGHVYGPGEEKFAKFLPKAIENIVEGKRMELWGDGTELRSFIYVDDVVKAVLAAVDLSMDVGVINIVGGRVMSIRELLDQLIAISGKQIEIVVKKNSGPKRDYVFDNTKLVTYLLPQEVDFLYGLRMEYEHIARLR